MKKSSAKKKKKLKNPKIESSSNYVYQLGDKTKVA